MWVYLCTIQHMNCYAYKFHQLFHCEKGSMAGMTSAANTSPSSLLASDTACSLHSTSPDTTGIPHWTST